MVAALTDEMQGTRRYVSIVSEYIKNMHFDIMQVWNGVYIILQRCLIQYLNCIASIEVILASVKVTARSFWFVFLLLLEGRFSIGKRATHTGPTNTEVLHRAQIPSIYTLPSQRSLRWLGHVHRMADGRIPKDLLYDELSCGKRALGRPHLRFKDICKRDMKALYINTEKWEEIADNPRNWRQELKRGLNKGETRLQQSAEEQRTRRKHSQSLTPADSVFKCSHCDKDCHKTWTVQPQQTLCCKCLFDGCRSIVSRDWMMPNTPP
jgi:hypothetical protein